MNAIRKLRCAVYTRKSSEEGLDQEFNSLDAQREACAAFIASQVGLGWKLVVDRYDDGGISGGTMERPGLKRLLADISARRIDVVVVYKIDRLTRSLADFAKIVEVFDGSEVSFVSVTQQFNTTNSMGRLTLNVLLSFAQFEREVTAERIRDKIAASKKKGMWMGGRVPLGYQVDNRKLLIREPEASFVRKLFQRYLDLRSVPALAAETAVRASLHIETDLEPPTFQSYSRTCSAGMLYNLLSNPIYVGKLRHKDRVHDGEHEAIVDARVFDRVQQMLAEQAATPRGASAHADVHLLTGLLHDDSGDRMSPSHAKAHGRRYRYYISCRIKGTSKSDSSAWRVPAQELETIVNRFVRGLLADRAQIAKWVVGFGARGDVERVLKTASQLGEKFFVDTKSDQRRLLQALLTKIQLCQDAVRLTVNVPALLDRLDIQSTRAEAIDLVERGDLERSDDAITIEVPVSVKRRGNEMRLVISGDPSGHAPDQALVTLIARAHHYLHQLIKSPSMSIRDLAKANGVHRADVSRILPLAFLSPDLTDRILTGRQPAELSARRLARMDLPMLWADQLDAVA